MKRIGWLIFLLLVPVAIASVVYLQRSYQDMKQQEKVRAQIAIEVMDAKRMDTQRQLDEATVEAACCQRTGQPFCGIYREKINYLQKVMKEISEQEAKAVFFGQ